MKTKRLKTHPREAGLKSIFKVNVSIVIFHTKYFRVLPRPEWYFLVLLLKKILTGVHLCVHYFLVDFKFGNLTITKAIITLSLYAYSKDTSPRISPHILSLNFDPSATPE